MFFIRCYNYFIRLRIARHQLKNWSFNVFHTLRKKRLTKETTLKGTCTSMKYEVKWKEIFDHKSKRNFDYDYSRELPSWSLWLLQKKKKYFLRVSINLCEFYSKSILIFSLFMIYAWVLLITYNVDKINDFNNSYKKLYSFSNREGTGSKSESLFFYKPLNEIKKAIHHSFFLTKKAS